MKNQMDMSEINENHTFSYALAEIQMNTSFRAARRGWNGKNMWVAVSPGYDLKPEQFFSSAGAEYAKESGGTAHVGECLIFKAADGIVEVGWRPTSRDMFASDWVILVK